MEKKTLIIHNNQNRDKLNDDLQKFAQTVANKFSHA